MYQRGQLLRFVAQFAWNISFFFLIFSIDIDALPIENRSSGQDEDPKQKTLPTGTIRDLLSGKRKLTYLEELAVWIIGALFGSLILVAILAECLGCYCRTRENRMHRRAVLARWTRMTSLPATPARPSNSRRSPRNQRSYYS